MAVHRSVVKWFDNKKGYGFIEHPEGGTDIFVHYSAIASDKRFKTLKTGQVVQFELSDGPKGLHAQNVLFEEMAEEPVLESAVAREARPLPVSTPEAAPALLTSRDAAGAARPSLSTAQ